jgi:hypothetical protein
MPHSTEPVSFEIDVKPMFRERDRRSMELAFDLWSRDDVSEHADAILARVKGGHDALRRLVASGAGRPFRALDHKRQTALRRPRCRGFGRGGRT